ncbi:hypothetical protein GCM10023080_066830 [Streptomyces pseudoechinosporeus]
MCPYGSSPRQPFPGHPLQRPGAVIYARSAIIDGGLTPVDFVHSSLGSTEPEGVEAEGGDRAVRTGLEHGIGL